MEAEHSGHVGSSLIEQETCRDPLILLQRNDRWMQQRFPARGRSRTRLARSCHE